MSRRQLKKMKKVEASYVAGIIDGEGTITLTRESKLRKFKTPHISVPSTSHEILDAMINLVGGGNIIQKKKYKKHHKQSYVWTVTGRQCVDLCKMIFPFLRETKKKRRAEKFAKEWNKITPINGKYSEKILRKKLKFEKTFFDENAAV